MYALFRSTAIHILGIFSVLVLAAGVGIVADHHGRLSTDTAFLGGQVLGADQTLSADSASTIDSVSPTAPVGLTAVMLAPLQVELRWEPSSDNTGVIGYTISRNGFMVGNVTTSRYLDEAVVPLGVYAYTVRAFDAAGNSSAESQAVTIVIPEVSLTSETVAEPTSTTTSIPVQFSVLPAGDSAGVVCVDGVPQTEVFFAIEPTTGGIIELRAADGSLRVYEHGVAMLKNGGYSWRGVARPGYVLITTSADSGSFSLEVSCDGTLTTSLPVVLASVATASPVDGLGVLTVLEETGTEASLRVAAATSPSIRFLKDEVPYPSRPVLQGNVEVRIAPVVGGGKVVFTSTDAESGKYAILGVASRDDLLSLGESEVFSMHWNTSGFPDGTYRIGARIAYQDGSSVDVPPVQVSVQNTQVRTLSASAITTEVKDVPSGSSGAARPESRQWDGPLPDSRSLEEILRSIDGPEQCQQRDACAAYCASRSDLVGACRDFARTVIRVRVDVRSVADHIPELILEGLLGDGRPRGLPEEVRSPEDFRAFCSDPVNEERCGSFLVAAGALSGEELAVLREGLLEQRIRDRRVFTERVGARPFIDLDHDGVSDYDEVNVYGTDPDDVDTDHDGFSDGEELLARTNPLGGPSSEGTGTDVSLGGAEESLPSDDPRFAGTTESDLLVVHDVAVTATTSRLGKPVASELTLTGTALPGMYVTLYIFSDPYVVTVLADDTGTWAYQLHREIPDGTHEVFTAITDLDGRILAKSDPLPFVKEAAAVSIGSDALIGSAVQGPGFFTGPSLYAIIAIIIGILGVGLSVVGFMIRSRGDEPDEVPSSS